MHINTKKGGTDVAATTEAASDKRNADIKRGDQTCLLETCLRFADTGQWEGVFTYPACGADLVKSGLVDATGKVTTAGRAAMFLLGKGADPFPDSKAFQEFSLPLRDAK